MRPASDSSAPKSDRRSAYRSGSTTGPASASSVRTVTLRPSRRTVRTQLTLTAPIVEPERYADLRALFGSLESDAGRTVLLRRKE